MDCARREFLASSLLLLTGTSIQPSIPPMSHVVLLGDSIFDNGSYTSGKPDVIAQVRGLLPAGWKATLLAVDGATTGSIGSQLARLPADATHMVLSVGGNDALIRQNLLDMPVKSSAEALTLLAGAAREFEGAYRKAVGACLRHGLPLTVCTIYNGNFPDAGYAQRAATALTVFNDAIIRTAVEKRLAVIDLRLVCDRPEDYANPIEPSSVGGAKIAKAIVRTVAGPAGAGQGAHVTG
jgi:GDSL-like Lipase/Acylhydrolase family